MHSSFDIFVGSGDRIADTSDLKFRKRPFEPTTIHMRAGSSTVQWAFDSQAAMCGASGTIVLACNFQCGNGHLLPFSCCNSETASTQGWEAARSGKRGLNVEYDSNG